MKKLTVNAQRLYAIIQAHGPMSLQQMKVEMGFRSVAPVEVCLKRLFDAGLVRPTTKEGEPLSQVAERN